MINKLVAHKQELEAELQERVQAFFEKNNASPESVSIEMKLRKSGRDDNLSTIHILVKDARTGATLMTV